MSKSNTMKTPKSIENESENENVSRNHQIPLLPPSSTSRSPLNTIPDPCQSSGSAATPARVWGMHKGKLNSATSTPARSATSSSSSRVSNVYNRNLNLRGGGTISRPNSAVNSENSLLHVVPHFELLQDPSFWKDHNVQVLIRIRPLSNMEKVSQGYGNCLKQESAQTLVWLGHPETRFTFDHVACQTISQEKLFMVAGLPMVDNCMSGYNSCMFAYGQTGSGKTYTMMGEIGQVDGKLDEHCGITPRIFEYLFTRIKEDEEIRRSEGLKYSCKCSFLEIYNEQITDLLEPSSTNLQLREDLKKGVYVENLSEYDVRSANDVISLLREGAANRKMAATHMNSESSRSHSVFTCIVESSWEKDSMNHFRFARLNLVDLAGSERQKSSGAEGDRLKEAANINKSLSTLGLVIMSLVDLAHGKQRHVPYRDSRLTFLLQDSLGGNSKTTIIANVSPSICSANETLSTLKFAQRAKLIQNNAKVNEDASGDVTSLQQQIQLLKGQLNFLMKHQDPSKHHSNCLPSTKESCMSDFLERCDSVEDMTLCDDDMITCGRDGKVKRLKTTLLGALRREKLAEMELRRLKMELEQMKCLVYQREEDAKLTKMMLTFQEERIKRLELCADRLLSADKYLLDENNALREEIQVLQARTNKNPEITKLELENARLLQQLKLVQNFYEQGEREMLLAELSELRDQFLELLETEGSYWQPRILPAKDKQSNVAQELEECRDMNSRLIREADELQRVLDKHMKCNQDESDSGQPLSIESDQLDDLTCHKLQEDQLLLSKKDQIMDTISILQFKDIEKQLVDARFLMETMESKQVCLIEELEFMREENRRLTGMLNKKEMERQPGIKCEDYSEQSSSAESQHLDLEIVGSEDISKVALQANLDKLSEDLQEALSLNSQYLQDHASRLSQDHQIELVRYEVEMETAKTILYLQEELVALQSEFEERLCTMAEENAGLRKTLAAKDDEISALSAEWERAILELTSFLLDGSKSLRDASRQIEGIASSFPQVHVWIGEHVERAAKICIQKEETILLLQHSLEDAQKTVVLMNQKLNSLKGATIALSEVEQLDNDISNEVSQLITAFDDDYLQKNVKCNGNHTAEAARSAEKMIYDHPAVAYRHNIEGDMTLTDVKALESSEVDIVGELVRQAQLETADALNTFCSDAETYLSALKSDIQEAVFIYKDLLQDLVNDIREARRNCFDLKVNGGGLGIHTCGIPCDSHKFINHGDQQQLLHQLKDELVKTNERLNTVNVYFYKMVNSCGSPEREEDSGEAVRLTTDCPASFSNHSADCVASGSRSDGVCFRGYECPVRNTDLNLEFEERSIVTSHSQESEKLDRLGKSLNHDELLVCLRNEFKSAYGVFSKLNTQLDGFFTEKDGDCDAPGLSLPAPLAVMMDNNHGPIQDGRDQPIMPVTSPTVQYHELITQKANANCNNTIELDAGKKFTQATSFFTKIEEAHATMKEADHMLKTLLKANENAKQLSFMWKQAGEELQFEKASLIEEIQQLKSSISIREGENGILQDQICYSLSEIANSIALLEGAFEYMQKDVEDFYKVAYFDALRTVKETLTWICSFRVMLEELFTKAMENEIISFFLECHVKDFIQKLISIITNYDLCPVTVEYEPLEMKNAGESYTSCEDHCIFKLVKWAQERNETATVRGSEGGESTQVHGDPENENLELKKELERKEVLLKGLLFDFRLLQESASSRQDFKDEFEKLLTTLNKVQYELQIKTSELDELLLQHRALEERLSETENAVTSTKSDLEHARRTSNILSEQNADLRLLLKDLYLKKSEAEEQLEEQKEVVKSLEEEILRMTSSTEKQLASSVKEDDLRRVTEERDKLLEQLQSLQVRLDMAFALADENEAIAVEARQESEASKMYAEQKEEEVKILERSVEELECTINVLETKVYGMEDEVQRQHLIRDSLELEIQALTDRLSTVENLTENLDSEDSNSELSKGHISRSLEVHEAQRQIRILEAEKAELVKEIKQCKEYISELVLHAEAQASQYQEKYTYLEAMFREAKMDSSNVTYAVQTSDKTEKTSTRSRGSSSPFRCITNLVQQMNLEKDQELSIAKVRIEELEALAASRQKEVCVLHSRLAAAESMTHDVIRDLLGVKLDMTNYANLADQYQLQKLVEDAQQQKQESATMEKENFNLRRQVVDLTEERERCISEVHRRETDVLAAQMTLEQLKERDQLLTAQNEMLKVDKTNLQRRIAELDDMVKKSFGTQDIQSRNQQTIDLCKGSSNDLSQRVGHSGKQLLQVDDLLSRPRRLDCTLPHRKWNGHENETKYR